MPESTTPVSVGLISKPEHCKPHLQALLNKGYDAVCLGGDTGIFFPEDLEVVVLRTQSCSHGASAQAFAHARKTGKPLIVKNGLSGMLAELSLRFPKPTCLVPETQLTLPSSSLVTFSLPSPYPTDSLWAKSVKEPLLLREGQTALELHQLLTDKQVREVRDLYFSGLSREDQKLYPPQGFPENLQRGLAGRPVLFFLFFLGFFNNEDNLYVTDLLRVYRDFSGKNTNHYTIAATAWAAGITVYALKETPLFVFRPRKSTGHTPKAEPLPPLVLAEAPTVEGTPSLPEEGNFEKLLVKYKREFDEHLLELMTQVQDLTSQVQNLTSLSQVLRTGLESSAERLRKLEENYNNACVRIETLEGDLYEIRKAGSGPTVRADSVLDALDALKARGAKISINFSNE